jgi:1,4-dihydroxy-2-naphthoate octaprenyltransferase
MWDLKPVLGPMRAPFLVLTPACVLLGVATAVWSTANLSASGSAGASGGVSALHVILAFTGALSAHISVNAFNEYWDFRSGLDMRTSRTPFSGGSGTLPQNPEFARRALITAIATLAITGLVGVYFLLVRGPYLLPLGLAGLVIIVAYTTRLTRMPFLCLVAPGLGFGLFMVMGTDFVLSGTYSPTAFFASLVPFFLVSDLLLLNQFPDVEADESVGRKHYPILIGRRASSLVYGGFLLATYLSIVLGVVLEHLPGLTLIGLITAVPAVFAFVGSYRHADEVSKLVPFMTLNVLICVLTPVLVALGLLLA